MAGQVGELCVRVILYPLQEEEENVFGSFLFASLFPSLMPSIGFSDCCILHSQEKNLHFSQHLAMWHFTFQQFLKELPCG